MKPGDKVKLRRPKTLMLPSRAVDRVGVVLPSKTPGHVRVQWDGQVHSRLYLEKMVEVVK